MPTRQRITNLSADEPELLSTIARSRSTMMAAHSPPFTKVSSESRLATTVANYPRKCTFGQSRLARLGFRLGGYAGYGLRRLLVAQDGTIKYALKIGEWKGIASDRIVLAPGPPEEVETVRLIFSLFVRERKNERQISEVLNARGIDNGLGRQWGHNVISRMLRNEKYLGNQVWNRSSFKWQQVHVKNDPHLWIRVDGAFKPIIDQSMFDAAQAIFKSRGRFTSVGRPRGL